MHMPKKHTGKIGYLVSIIFLILVFKDTNFGLIVGNFKYVNFYYISVALICNFCFFLIRGFYQINNLHYIKPNIRFSISVTSIGIAQFFNVIFPARLGEVIRAFFLSKNEDISKTSILSYIFIEKVIDFLVILFLLFVIVMFGFENVESKKALTFLSILVTIIIVGIFTFIRFNRVIINVLEKIIPNKIHKLVNKLNKDVLEGFKFYKSIEQIIRSIILLITSWVMIVAIFWFISKPYIKVLELPFYSCLFFMVFSALSLSIPSAPAGIGVMHYGLFLAIKLLSNNAVESQINIVAAFVIMMHFIVMSLDVIVGGCIIIYHKIISKDSVYIREKDAVY